MFFIRSGIVLFMLTALILEGRGQQTELSGKVIDAETKEPIPFANIALKEIYKGTACNVNGEFSFKTDSLPVVLVISHLSYEPTELTVTEDRLLTVELTPGKLLLDELVIKAKGNDEYAYQLVDKAYHRITSSWNRNNFGKAFYRQISKNGDEYSELYEIFYDTKYSNNGIEDWAIQEGRYALKLSTADSFIYNKNFTLMVRLLSVIQPNTDDLIMPISRDVREEYYLVTDRILSVNNRKVALIRFEVKEEVLKPAMQGEMLIDTESFEVLKITGEIVHDDLKFVTLKSKTGSWKNYRVSFEFAFKRLENNHLAPEYMQLGQSFDYYVNDVFINKVETESFFSYYEYYEPPEKKKLGGRLLRFNRRDSELLDNIGYNQLFWDENIIVKRTPIEAEVIRSFEEERAFGSIYLNNKSQIEIEDFTVDRDPYIVKVKTILNEYDLTDKLGKIYLHLDKPRYAAGETVLLKAYFVNADNLMNRQYEGDLIIDLLAPDGRNVLSKTLSLDAGSGAGGFVLPNSLASAVYMLKARIAPKNASDLIFDFIDEIEILNPNDQQEWLAVGRKDSIGRLFYHPEGNVLINGLPNQLGFVSTDVFKKTVPVKGKISDQYGQSAGILKSQFEGFGSVFIMPKIDVKFQTVQNSESVDIESFPKIAEAGYAVMINTLRPNAIEINVNGTMKLEGEKFYLLMISNGILYDRRVGILTRGLYKTQIPKSNLPSGISQLLLVDNKGVIRCKRPVFCDQPHQAYIKYYLAKRNFEARERVDLVLEIKDENGKPLSDANVSVAVLDEDKISRSPTERNIVTYLELEYLADYHIENPGLLFGDSERETLKNLDLVMVNQQTVFPEFEVSDSIRNVNGLDWSAKSRRIDKSDTELNPVNERMSSESKQYAEQIRQDRLSGGSLVGLENFSGGETVFEFPDYSDKDGVDPNRDLRSTVYWNPLVVTNKKGRAKISFYNSDTAKNFQITVEGLSSDGLPIFDVYSFGKNAGRKK